MIVYKCINLINGKIYIGKTYNFKKRKLDHFNSKSNSYFHNALRKYKKENFQWDILNEIETNKEAIKLEVFWIDYFKSNNSKFGYNMTIGGEGLNGYKLTNKHKRKIGMANSIANKGHKHSEKTKLKMSLSRMGHKKYNKGYKHSKKTKQKISNSNMGKKHSEETRQKLRNAKMGYKNPQSKKIICLELNKIFDTIISCSLFFNIPRTTLTKYIRENKSLKGYMFKFYN